MTQHIVAVANAIRAERYPDAAAVFAAGSIVRGEGTAFSDLDLVIVHGRLDRAYRESFRYDGVPVEAFVHDPETLEYFFQEVDRPSGVPALAHMVFEGIEIPGANDLSRILKDRAASFIAAGPPALDVEGERRLRYVVTDLLDDLRGARSDDDRVAIGSRLYRAARRLLFPESRVVVGEGQGDPAAAAPGRRGALREVLPQLRSALQGG